MNRNILMSISPLSLPPSPGRTPTALQYCAPHADRHSALCERESAGLEPPRALGKQNRRSSAKTHPKHTIFLNVTTWFLLLLLPD